MDWHIVSGILAAVLMVVATAPYIRDMLRGSTRPNIVSWGIWALAVGISTLAQFFAEPSWSLVLVASIFVMDMSVLVVALFGYGYTKFHWWDGACFVLSLTALVLWRISGNPLIALGFGIAVDAIAFVPTFIKSYREPFTETPSSWLLFGLSGLAGIAAAGVIDFASVSFAVYYFVANTALGMLLIARQKAGV